MSEKKPVLHYSSHKHDMRTRGQKTFNVFNILFVIGTTSLITPVPFPANFIPDMAVAIGAALLLWAGVLKKHALGRGVGVVMLLAYAGYFAYLCR